MSIPFFSIDFRLNDWISYLNGTMGINYESRLDEVLKKRFKDKHIVKFPSSRMGFYLFLEQNFKAGDEIIFSSMSFPLYVKMSIQLGLVPILVDVESNHLNINPELILKNITKKTKALVVTHLFGHPAYIKDIQKICNEQGIELIEDCAQSIDSFYENIETGNFGNTSFYSTGAVKVPTSLGGGIMATKNKLLANQINLKLQNKLNKNSIKKTFPYFLKNLISILNSYPFMYSFLSHNILNLLRKRNPELLRKIFYSGMGTDNKFNPWERPKQGKYQYGVALSQFDKIRDMTSIRRRNSQLINEIIKDTKNIKFFKESENCFWNNQYHVIYIEKNVKKIYNEMFKIGIHLLEENVWDCASYNFAFKFNHDLPVTKHFAPKLIRIPNNSYLSEKLIKKIAFNIKKISDNLN